MSSPCRATDKRAILTLTGPSCTVSSYTAADWNLTSGVVPPATATHYPVTRTRVSSKLPYTSTPSTTASSTAEAIVTPPASGSSGSPWTIVGATIGGIVSAIVLAIALFLLARRKPRRGHNEDEAQPLKRGGSPEMMEAGIDSGRMDLGPSLGMGAGAASASSGAGGGGRSMPNRSRPTSIWDPSYVPEPVVRKASVTAPTTRSIVAISSLAEPASVVIAAGPPVRAAAGARTSLPPLPRSSSVPTIHEDILSRPKSLVVAPGASAETRSISGGSDGGMRAYPAGIGRTAAGYDTYSRGIEHDDDDESYMGIGMSRYSSLGEASMAELHRVMMEEAAAAQPPEVSVVQTPLLPKLALPSLNSVRTSVHSEHGVLPPSGVAARPLPDPQAFQPAPLAQLVPPAANPSMILPAFPSVRQQTMAANSASPATSDSQAPYRMPSYYVEPSERFADA